MAKPFTSKTAAEQAGRAHSARRALKIPAKSILDGLPGANAAQRALIAERLSQMPISCRGVYLRAMRGKSLRSAATAFCLECVGWDRSAVRSCTAPACPLHPYRPFRGEIER